MILGFAIHAAAAAEDWLKQKFHALPFLLYIPYITVAGTGPGPGSIPVISAGLLGWHQNYLRPGDLLLLASYSLTHTSLQSFFTLTTVTGLYLLIYKKMNIGNEWIPFAPAILTAYLLQLII